MPIKKKPTGFGLDIKSFVGNDGNSYIVFRTQKGSYHVFMEVEAKEAARQCGAETEGTTQQMWSKIWKSQQK